MGETRPIYRFVMYREPDYLAAREWSDDDPVPFPGTAEYYRQIELTTAATKRQVSYDGGETWEDDDAE